MWWVSPLHALAMVLIALAAGCDFPGRPNQVDRPVVDDKILSFDILYRRHCAGCHGSDGRLGPAPPLNDATFLAIVPDEELLKVISEGRRNTPMPAFVREQGGELTAAQVKALAEGIKPRWKKDVAPPADLPEYLQTKSAATATSPEALERGAQIFARACADCHGSLGSGKNGNEGVNIGDPAFLALISDQALRRIVITGRPDLGMPTFAEKGDVRPDDFQPLTATEIDDLVTLLNSWRKNTSTASQANKKSSGG